MLCGLNTHPFTGQASVCLSAPQHHHLSASDDIALEVLLIFTVKVVVWFRGSGFHAARTGRHHYIQASKCGLALLSSRLPDGKACFLFPVSPMLL